MIEKAKYDNMFERQKAVAGMREKFIQTMQNRNLKTKQQMLSTFQQYGQRVIEQETKTKEIIAETKKLEEKEAQMMKKLSETLEKERSTVRNYNLARTSQKFFED